MQHTLRDVTHPSNNPFFIERVEKILRKTAPPSWILADAVRASICVCQFALTRSFRNVLNLGAGRDTFCARDSCAKLIREIFLILLKFQRLFSRIWFVFLENLKFFEPQLSSVISSKIFSILASPSKFLKYFFSIIFLFTFPTILLTV